MAEFSSDLVDETTACRILGGEQTPIHRSTLYRGVNEGRFPAPLKIGRGTNRWRAGELSAVIEKAASDRALKIGRAS
ncbi:MAG: helix-turn-helix transcriptional regulator [Parvibaculaceae bacterium]